MISKLKISQKLILIHVFSTLAVLLIAGTALVWLYGLQYQDNFESRIGKQGVLVASNVTAAVLFEDWEGAGEILNALSTDAAIVSAQLLSSDGEIKARIEERQKPSEILKKRVPVMDGSEQIAWVVIEADSIEVKEAIRRSVVAVSALIFMSLLFGVAISSRIQRIVTAPIFALSRVARQVIHNRDYSVRAKAVHKDEVGTLTEDFNTMLEIISRRDQELEKKVAERTTELNNKNTELQAEIIERERINSEKREIQERFENAFHNAPIGMALVLTDGTMMQLNKELGRLLRVELDQIINVREFIHVNSHDALSVLSGKLASGSLNSCDLETDCHNSNNDQLHCVLNFSAVHDDFGGFKYAIMQVNDVTESKRLSSELAFQASHDVLTGLSNRRVLEEQLRQVNEICSALATPFNLMLLDLDQFKIVNDSCGHAAGDALLVQISTILLDCVRDDDTVARLGGDEFAVLLHSCDQKAAARVAEKIRSSVEQLVFQWDGMTFRPGVSIGLLHVSTPAADTSEIMRKADTACYSAKEAGRNQVFIAEKSEQEYKERQGELQSVQRIREAMEKNYFVLFTQSVVSLQHEEKSNREEVLLRFRSGGTDKLIPPGAFLPVAERYGLSIDIDRWVVNRLIALLKRTDVDKQETSYWVNLNGSSLGDAKFLSFLEESIGASGLPAGTINFEITETEVIRNLTKATEAMTRLKSHGCQFALDDFGTGLSSFGYLKRLPVDYIKIDGMFVRDIVKDNVSRIFVKSIIDIARVMEIKTVAEFVENQDIVDVVTQLGADYGQGFGLGRPKELFRYSDSQRVKIEGAGSSRRQH